MIEDKAPGNDPVSPISTRSWHILISITAVVFGTQPKTLQILDEGSAMVL